MRRVERQVIRQPSRPSDSLPVPRSHRQRVTRGGDSLEQRARQQRQTEAAGDARLTPASQYLHRTRALGDIEVGLNEPAVGIRAADLGGGQLPRSGAEQQRPLVGRVIYSHDIDPGLRSLPEVQVAPAAHSQHQRNARSNSASSKTLPRSMARLTRCQPQRNWRT